MYYKYFKFGGIGFFYFNLLIFLLGVLSRIFSIWFTGAWSSDLFDWEVNGNRNRYIYILLATGVISFLIVVLQSYTWAFYSSITGYRIFKNLLNIIF